MRKLKSHSITEMEALFDQNQDSPAALANIIDELKKRKTNSKNEAMRIRAHSRLIFLNNSSESSENTPGIFESIRQSYEMVCLQVNAPEFIVKATERAYEENYAAEDQRAATRNGDLTKVRDAFVAIRKYMSQLI